MDSCAPRPRPNGTTFRPVQIPSGVRGHSATEHQFLCSSSCSPFKRGAFACCATLKPTATRNRQTRPCPSRVLPREKSGLLGPEAPPATHRHQEHRTSASCPSRGPRTGWPRRRPWRLQNSRCRRIPARDGAPGTAHGVAARPGHAGARRARGSQAHWRKPAQSGAWARRATLEGARVPGTGETPGRTGVPRLREGGGAFILRKRAAGEPG